MAVLLEIHYDKDEILETYLNEIYLGQDRDRAIHGVGLAAQYYFGKDVQYLTRRGVGAARRHGQAARRTTTRTGMRRARSSGATWCCARRATRARITLEQYAAARASAARRGRKAGMRHLALPGVPRAGAPAAAARLRREGPALGRPAHLHHARPARAGCGRERARRKRLAQFDKDKRFGQPGLEGAVVITDPQSGEVQAHGRRARRALPRLQPRARRGAPGGLASEACHLSDGAERARRATRCSRRSTTGRSCGRAAARRTGSR